MIKTRAMVFLFLLTVFFDCAYALSDQTKNESYPFAVPVTPGIYLTNFMVMYISNPEKAALMPAFRAPIPRALADCLSKKPRGCDWERFKPYFVNSSQDNISLHLTQWNNNCQMKDKNQQDLAPPVFTTTNQINAPLGRIRAKSIADALKLEKNMILTPEEYQCMIGSDPTKRTDVQKIIYQCMYDLTNSTGNSGNDMPLASYGLSITPDRLVQSDCAPAAPCLLFNQLFTGPLQRLAVTCGFEEKLQLLRSNTSFMEIITQANQCQSNSQSGCVVETK